MNVLFGLRSAGLQLLLGGSATLPAAGGAMRGLASTAAGAAAAASRRLCGASGPAACRSLGASRGGAALARQALVWPSAAAAAASLLVRRPLSSPSAAAAAAAGPGDGAAPAGGVAADDDALDPSTGRVVFVGNLPWSLEGDQVADAMGPRTPGLQRVLLMRRRGRPSGMARVEYESPEAAQAAIQALDGWELEGRALRAEVARARAEPPAHAPGGAGGDRPRSSADPGATLFFTNLAWEVSWQDLKDWVVQGSGQTPQFVDVRRTPEGRSRGFAIVRFEDAGAAAAAVDALDQRELSGRPVGVRAYEPAGERRGDRERLL